MGQGRFALPENICSSPLIDSSEGTWMRLRHVLISYRFVSTAGVGGRNRDPPTYIRCALLRKPAKGLDSNGM